MTSDSSSSGGGGPSALAARLEKGWDLLGQGDLAGAREEAEAAVDLDGESADARVLLGSLAAAEGDPEEALELMQQAMELDSAYLRPVLAAAEICIHHLGDMELGMALCQEAGELAGDDQEELLEVLLLRVEGHLVMGDPAAVEELGLELARLPLEAPPRSLRIGRVLLELEQVERAREHLGHAAGEPALEADARYLLGVAADGVGELGEAEDQYMEALQLDRQTPEVPWAFQPEAVQRALEQAMDLLEPEDLAVLESLPRVVADLPPMELVCEGVDPRSIMFLGARSGVLSAAREAGDRKTPPMDELLPTRIFIYRRNLERVCFNEEEMAEELAFTLEDELALLGIMR